MRKHLLINGSLVVVAAAIGVGAYANIGSGATTTASRETIVTAKRAVVLSSVSSTGNVEATTDLGVSFQQTGKVTAIYVKVGDHVTAGQQLAQIDDTQQAAALAVRAGVTHVRARRSSPDRCGAKRPTNARRTQPDSRPPRNRSRARNSV